MKLNRKEMEALKLIRSILIVALLTININAGAQNTPSGGYQGGTHGNIKVKTWSGAVDEKWNVAGNWCPAGVPKVQDDVVIPVTATTPEVKVSGMSCKNLVIRTGATLKITSGQTLTVTGQMTIEQ
jgi:hypothetical protein